LKSLSGRRILITKGRNEAGNAIDLLSAEGAEIIFFPTIKTVPVYDTIENDPDSLKNEIRIIKEKIPDLFVFTSPSSFKNSLTAFGGFIPAQSGKNLF